MDITVAYYNESYAQIHANPGVLREIIDYFSFLTEGYRFHPKVKMGIWDGKIRLVTHQGLIPQGLVEQLQKFASNMMYEIEVDSKLSPEPVVSREEFDMWLNELDIWSGHSQITPHWYQADSVFQGINQRKAVLNLPTSAGKAQPLDCAILTPSGWQTMGDMKIGSQVTTPSGDTATVIAVHPQGVKDIFEITFKDGRKTRCCKEHLWKVQSNDFNGRDWKIKSLDWIMNRKDKRTLYVPTPVIEKPNMELPIDPYVIGALIGDGSLSQNQKGFASVDPEITALIESKLPHGVVIESTSAKYGYSIKGEWRTNGKCESPIGTFKKTLNELGLCVTSYHKHIPENYKNGSVEQRLELLRGLMDTDGTVGKNGDVSFCSVSKQLVEDVIEVARSIGCAATFRIRKTQSDFGTAYETTISHHDRRELFTLERKKARVKQTSRFNNKIAIVDIKQVESAEAQCITLDTTDHLYVTDDYIVTHNSLIQSLLSMYYLDKIREQNEKVLLIVPTTALVTQMMDDMVDYRLFGYDNLYGIKGGVDRDAIGEREVVVSTWQSAVKQPNEWFEQFGMLLVDECHLATSKSLDGIIKKMTKCQFKIGLTGSLRDGKANIMQYVGSFGSVFRPVSTTELMEQGQVTDLAIKCLMLEYPQHLRDELKGTDYQSELKFLLSNKQRNRFFIKLAYKLSAKQGDNTLLLFKNIKHGKLLYEALSKIHDKVFYVSGETKTDARTEVKKLAEDIDGAIIVASYGVFSTGISIKKLHHVIFAHPTKSKVTTLQSIGRVLRKHGSKAKATLWDIIDNLAIKPKRSDAKKQYSHVNYTLKHGLKRIELYNQEHFEYVIRKIEL